MQIYFTNADHRSPETAILPYEVPTLKK